MAVGKNAQKQNASSIWESGTFYSQLWHIVAAHCEEASEKLGIIGPSIILLVTICTCKIEDKNPLATSILNKHGYSKHGELHIMDITGVQCLIGWVMDGNRWFIADWSGFLVCAIHEHEADWT